MPWYYGPTLLEYLETVPLRAGEANGPVRFPVQLVLRPDANFRGFAGQVARGVLRAGERVIALPSRRETTVKRIVTYDGDLEAAAYPQSVTVELEDEIDLSRGEMLVSAADATMHCPRSAGISAPWWCGCTRIRWWWGDLCCQAHDADGAGDGAGDPVSRGRGHAGAGGCQTGWR